MHVLIIPSWYPENAYAINGCFFREQALGLKQCGCQVGILSVTLQSLKYFHCYRLRWQDTYESDKGLLTYRARKTNFFPKMPFIQQQSIVAHGVRFFSRYAEHVHMPELMHAHSVFSGGILAYQIYKTYGIPFVLTEHSSAYGQGRLSRRQIEIVARVQDAARGCYAVSSSLAVLLEEMLGKAKKWQVQHNSVSDAFLEEAVSPYPPKPFTLLTVSLLVPVKNVELILKAFALIYRDQSDSQLRIGGDGPEKGRLKRLSKKLGIQNNVHFLGALSREQVKEEMKSCHAFVLGSRYETFGVVLIEAMAQGRPLIATRCAGAEDIVTNANGILVDNNDVVAMAAAMRQLHKSYHLYVPEILRQHCSQKFSSRNLSQKMLTHYSEALS